MSGPIRVLHVDDEPDLAETAGAFLERADERFGVETAGSASEGLDRLAEAEFDCVVSDYDMPGRNGIEFLEAVRETHPDIPFILYTGKGSEEVASDAISAGVTDYLQKESGTSQYEVLANRIANAVSQYRSRRDLEASQKRLSLFIDQSSLGVVEWDENFEFVDMNDAAERILGYDEAELEGASWQRIVPESDREAVGDVVDELLENRGGYHSLNENVRGDGERIICEWHNRVVTDETGDVVAIFSQFQNVTDRVERERSIEELHRTSRELMAAGTAEAVAETAAEAVRGVLDMPANGVFLHDEAEDCLRPVAWTDRGEELVGDVPTIQPGDGLAWRVFETGEAEIHDDVSTVPGRFNAETDVRSEIILPLSDHGVVIIGSSESDAFDETDVSLARTLAAHATTALDRIERESQLARQRSLLEAQQEAVLDGILVVDEDGEIVSYNDRFVDLWGIPEDVVEAGDDRAALDWAIDRLADPGEFEEKVEYLYEHPEETARDEVDLEDGRVFDRYTTPLVGEDGTHYGRLWTFRDVTAGRTHERRLEELQRWTRPLMGTTTREETAQVAVETAHEVLGAPLSGFHLLSEDGTSLDPVAFVDVAGEFGDPPTYDRGAEAGSISALVWETFETGNPRFIDDTREYDGLTGSTPARSGIIYPLADHGVFIVSSTEPNAFGEAEGTLVEIVATTLTAALDRAERESVLRRQNERLEEFASIVSHDLRNPLNVAEGRVEMARAERDSEHLEIVTEAHGRMEALIEDLLTLAREGERVTDVEPVDLDELLGNCWRNVETGDATLVIETDRTIRADRSRLAQLLENLMRNAVEHGSTSPPPSDENAVTDGSTSPPPSDEDAVEHGSTADGDSSADTAEQAGDGVTVTVGDLDGGTGFYVEDDGPGIPETEREQVFESGFSTSAGGTGFGLSIVREIATAHDWGMRVTESEGGGARLEITGVEAG
ncbi:MAG: GAF domain-containing protein [Halobacteriales archaeon]